MILVMFWNVIAVLDPELNLVEQKCSRILSIDPETKKSGMNLALGLPFDAAFCSWPEYPIIVYPAGTSVAPPNAPADIASMTPDTC